MRSITGPELKARREALGLKLAELAGELGYPGQNGKVTVWRWESGNRTISQRNQEHILTVLARLEAKGAPVNGTHARRAKVQALSQKGKKPDEIAEAVGVSTRQVYRDLAPV